MSIKNLQYFIVLYINLKAFLITGYWCCVFIKNLWCALVLGNNSELSAMIAKTIYCTPNVSRCHKTHLGDISSAKVYVAVTIFEFL